MRKLSRSIPILFLSIMIALISKQAYGQNRNLKIYGFFDLEAEVSDKDTEGKYGTFDQNNFNLLLDFRLDDRIRVRSELEWGHGAAHGEGQNIGDMYLAKAYLEYRFSELAQLRVGKFLTPFGIYNELHDATPTFVFTKLPSSIYGERVISPQHSKERLFAKEGAGIQLVGTVQPGEWLLRYQAYLTNGRGPKPYEQDNNANKAFGGRFTITPPFSAMHVGASLYRERNGNAHNALLTTFALEAEYDLSAFHVEAEALLSSIEYVDSLETPTGDFNSSRGSYVLASYLLFDRLTPFVRYDYFKPGLKTVMNSETQYAIGLNYSVTHKVFLKSELHLHKTFSNIEDKSYRMFVMSIAAAL